MRLLLLLFRGQRVVKLGYLIDNERLDDRAVGVDEVGEGLRDGGFARLAVGIAQHKDKVIFVVVPVGKKKILILVLLDKIVICNFL